MKIHKNTFILLLIFLLALILRIVAAYNVDISTDEMVYSIIPLNIISAGRLGTVFQSQLYFYLADTSYRLSGGLSPLAARFPSIVFGSFAVLAIYLLAVELFQDKKAALVSAFLFSLSGYALQYNIETDMPAFFLVLLSILFLVRGFKGKHHNFYLSSLFIALAMLVKNIVVVFIPAYLAIIAVYSFREKTLMFSDVEGKLRINKKFMNVLLISIGILILVILPLLIYNYMIYKYRGVTDFYFSSLGLGENIYSEIANKPWQFSRLTATLHSFAFEYLKLDGLIFTFGILGLFLSLKKNKYAPCFFIIMFSSLLAFVGGITGLGSHAVWLSISLSIFAGHALITVHEKIKLRFQFKYTLALILLLSVLLNVLYFQEVMERSKSNSIIPLWNFVHKYVPKDAIVIVDPRIYTGNSAWILNDRHHLEAIYFPQFWEKVGTSPEVKVNFPLYYIECGPESRCGWRAEQFASLEAVGKEISKSLVPNMKKTAELQGMHQFIIYQGSVSAPYSIYETIDQNHIFWFYPVGWKTASLQLVDDYSPQGFDIVLNKLGFLILYLDLFCTLLSVGYVIYLVKQRDNYSNG